MATDYKFNLETLINQLDFDLLQGWDAQKELAPPTRKPLEFYSSNLNNARTAAVLILLYEEDGEIKFPLILRNIYKGIHSNQIGLPGGKVEDFDSDLEATAKRETFEEIGANPEDINILGKLSDMYIPPSNFMVHPYVGYYKGKPEFVPCDIEVQQIVPVVLEEFMNLDHNKFTFKGSNGQEYEAPAYVLTNQLKLWGATAMMLNEFKLFVRKSLNL